MSPIFFFKLLSFFSKGCFWTLLQPSTDFWDVSNLLDQALHSWGFLENLLVIQLRAEEESLEVCPGEFVSNKIFSSSLLQTVLNLSEDFRNCNSCLSFFHFLLSLLILFKQCIIASIDGILKSVDNLINLSSLYIVVPRKTKLSGKEPCYTK